MVKFSDIVMDLVDGEKAKEIILKQESKKEIDEEIKEYIDAINEFEFVKTLVSCAGHRSSFWDVPYVVLSFSDGFVEEVFMQAMSRSMDFIKENYTDIFEVIGEAVDKIVLRRVSGDSVVYKDKTGKIVEKFHGESVVWVAVIYRDDCLELARKFMFEFMIGVLYGIERGLKLKEEYR